MPQEERNFYVICEDNCKFPAMTKEQVINAIAEATGYTPSEEDIDQAFITKIKEQNHNASLKWWAGTEAEYIALTTKANDTLYIITDTSEYDDLELRIMSAKSKSDFAIGTGTVTIPRGSTGHSNSTIINYPEGFNKDNCVLLNVAKHRQGASSWGYGDVYFTDWAVAGTIGSIPHIITFGEDGINVRLNYAATGSGFTANEDINVDVKLILMKF